MPPQQPERLLDLGDNSFGFRTHVRRQISDVRHQVSTVTVDRR
jgi:hypothetical protein